jgi:hypothetical protein
MATKEIYEIIARPPGGSTGENLIKLMTCLNVESRFVTAVVADIECNENRSWVGRTPFRTTPNEILAYAASVGQFDWATFFCFEEKLDAVPHGGQFNMLFANASLIIRAVDDTFFYVYSETADDASQIRDVCPIEVRERSRDSISHPS